MISQTTRYRWTKLAGMPPQVDLIDDLTSHSVATVFEGSRRWYWKRNTTVLLHGALPAEGVAVSLNEAKQQVVKGLPDGTE